MADPGNDDSLVGDSIAVAPTPAGGPVPRDKRDRENGIWKDSLVDARTKERNDLLQSTLTRLREENRLMEIYGFIIHHRPGTAVRPYAGTMGGYNAIFRVEYTDGDAVLRTGLAGSVAFGDEKVRNEVATMRYIEKVTSIPVPHIYHWGTAAENPLGLGAFIIMDYIPHSQDLSDVLGDPTLGERRQFLDPNVSEEKLERMYRQVAYIVLQLSKLEMPKIGSLRQTGDSFTVASRPLTQDMNDLVTKAGLPLSILPPENATYSTSDEWYAVLADLHVAHLTFQHNNAIDSPDDCRDKFVARHLFRQQVRRGKLLAPTTPPGKRWAKKEAFYLYVDDFRPYNILIDADLNVVGVIDWEWAYFAPASFSQAAPWWLLLGQPVSCPGTILDFRDRFAGALDVFLRALRAVEDAARSNEEEEGQEGWSLDQHIGALNLDPGTIRLSDCMRRSWENGDFWAIYAARRCYGFEPVFWEFLDERFFGENAAGGWEGRAHLLSEKGKRRMEVFVERKVEGSKEKKIVDWDPDEARACLAESIADFD
ncbi:hypothetical protein N658DRAFT_500906 [Parathielavia hyrcaniae]|uniref:Aminoglycoside phosphotransferase domain-containing protein n=1 Tax=Parathielavia hyrcaniae TaxID=113614 RepID=A0AAN6SY12_9PEZI|nr:hypothetical protein N658DRAFT_500906 [Parathielavia hyrcaniae]